MVHLIEENNRVRTPTDRLSQLPTRFVANVTGRRAHEARDALFAHVLGHVDAHLNGEITHTHTAAAESGVSEIVRHWQC